MTQKFFLSVPLLSLFFSFAQARTNDFEDLQALNAAAIQAQGLDAAALPADKSWGVSYSLTGVLAIHEERVFLNSPDGRVFQLDLSVRGARKFNGLSVRVEAKAKQADDMSVLKVVKVAVYNPAAEIKLPPYQPNRRRAQVLSDSPDALTVGNVRWLYGSTPKKDSFDWATARIRPELIKEVYFIKKPFPPEWIAAHSLLAFTFAKGGLTDADGNEASALTLSIEAFLREGQEYGLVDGLKNKFGIVWLLTTWEDYAARSALMDKARLIPYAVKNLSHAQKVQLLRESVKLAAVNREGEYYHTITNNCTNNLIIVINRVLPEAQRITMWTIPYLAYNLRATMPVWVPKYLQGKGLLGPELGEVNAANYRNPLP
ncbi:MAG: DUF4105 domain-containing protein [Elusimicrobia bacterium]|nr:DUF4105 domain-containing protein [Elusimicrobiota bacterium]